MDLIAKLDELRKTFDNKIIRLFKIEKYYKLNFEVFAKIEDTNFTGSIKDKTVFQMMYDAILEGKINKDTTLIEATSGNTGISISYIASYLGLKSLIVMPSSMSKQRRDLITQYGGELLLLEGGMKECEERVQDLLTRNPSYFCLDQFNNPSNPKAHYLITAPQIFSFSNEFDYIVDGFGTGGTVSGIGQYIKENNLKTKVIAVEPFESPLITLGFYCKHLIQGIGANFVPKTLYREYIYQFRTVSSEDALKMKKLLFELENIDVGISSGASLKACLDFGKNHPYKRYLCIFPDKGDRYE